MRDATELLSRTAAARLAAVNVVTVRRAVCAGELPARFLDGGQRFVIAHDDVERWIAARRAARPVERRGRPRCAALRVARTEASDAR